ncbi:probable LRR receptor-like serine/threonine-protein kinase At3g47570 [Dendrobium catenatum]|uniref:probable LRR receptor-like serine/threonine-protein kinase At3g47570 n=1 Tax=Dendrobium catenatum TaxID=906689 RepID=UPI0009F40970|nr:probable LRR receptor-like serine/threonine-protein kinase At3g47570 [Dendrobium catenatum]
MNLITPSIFFFFFFLCNSSPSHSPQTTASTDQLALLHFKSLLTDPTYSLFSWNSSLHFCQWEGVNCSITGRVTRLRLISLQLAGPISPSICNLTFLESLVLVDNNLIGAIPTEIDRLSNLVSLILNSNYLTGEIPTSIVRCSKLQFVHLRSNLFTGEITREIGLMSNLQEINLSENNITGTIPVSMSNISSLKFIDFAENMLVGSIPESIGRLANLQFLQMERNKFTGELPPSFFNLSSLYGVYLGFNNLEGTLPSSMFVTLPYIQNFLLSSNHFHGSIPASVANASHLIELDLSVNGFSGIIPSKLGNSQLLWRVLLYSNHLEANEDSDWDFMESLANCSFLVMLKLFDNKLGGVLPTSLANLSFRITVLSIAQNQIAGNLPVEIGNLVNLLIFEADNNLLTGSLPPSIGRLKSLHRLTLQGNKFNGQIPDSLSNLFELNQLYLHNNMFGGSLPSSFGKLENLQELDLSWNRFNGEIPKEVLSLQSLSVHLDLSNNLLTGSLPVEIGKLTNLNWFAAANNELSGEIPSSLGNCMSIEYLFLQGNSFQGAIPQSLRFLKGLRELDLSRNNLDWSIPMFFENFKMLQLLNLSFNELKGEVPANGVFKNSTAVSLYGNKQLCGGDNKLHLPLCDHEHSRSSNGKKHLKLALKIVIPVIGIILCLSFGIFIFIILCCAKHMQKKLSFNPVEVQFRRTSYAELLKATNQFSSSNLIGVGGFASVYKGIIEPGETIVAVKVLNLEREGALKSFMAECEALRDIRHRNLVKILTVCSSIDFRGNSFIALVLQYMPNGSLDQWLHQGGYFTKTDKLSFLQRLSIAVDVASTLDYLHNLGHAPIVHCDLKPSNVLLDEEMRAHLGDFGLAKILLDIDDNQAASIGIKGTIGYVPPEYGMGSKSSPQGDVYSYGIMLLELFTGRRPTDEIFKHDLSLRDYAESSDIDNLMEIIDPCLISEAQNRVQDSRFDMLEELKCLDSVIKIGLLCSLDDPKQRMKVVDVINQLNREGCFKLNTDGSMNNLNAGCGGVIRDFNGFVIMAFAGPSNATSAIQAEIEALLFGIQSCISLGIINIWIEVYALLLIHYLERISSSNPAYFYMLRDIKIFVSALADGSFVSRSHSIGWNHFLLWFSLSVLVGLCDLGEMLVCLVLLAAPSWFLFHFWIMAGLFCRFLEASSHCAGPIFAWEDCAD